MTEDTGRQPGEGESERWLVAPHSGVYVDDLRGRVVTSRLLRRVMAVVCREAGGKYVEFGVDKAHAQELADLLNATHNAASGGRERELEAALQDLVDHQNGPPLPSRRGVLGRPRRQ